MPNALRNQIELQLGQHRFLLKPTFTNLARLETRYPSIYALMSDITDMRKSKISDMAYIVQIFSDGKNKDGAAVKFDDIGQAIIATGVTNVIPALVDFMSKAIATDEDLEKARASLDGTEGNSLTV